MEGGFELGGHPPRTNLSCVRIIKNNNTFVYNIIVFLLPCAFDVFFGGMFTGEKKRILAVAVELLTTTISDLAYSVRRSDVVCIIYMYTRIYGFFFFLKLFLRTRLLTAGR